MSNLWNTKRILVTGATGLVGSWLIKTLLEKKAYIVAFVRHNDPQSEFFRAGLFQRVAVANGVLEDYSAIEGAINKHEIDTVFHLGAQTIVGSALRSPLATLETNVRGTYHLLEACRIHKSLVKSIVIASSDKAYGSSPTLPYTENHPLVGKHPYDVSKSCTDLIAQMYHHTYDLPLAIARCGNIFGGGDLNWSRIVPGTIKSLYLDQNPEIRSDGKATRDYIYVKDVVNAYLSLATHIDKEQVQGQAFNFGVNKPYSVLEIVDALQALMNKQHLLPKILQTAQSEIKHQTLSSDKAEKVLGWKATFDLKTALTETLEWYENYLSSYGMSLL